MKQRYVRIFFIGALLGLFSFFSIGVLAQEKKEDKKTQTITQEKKGEGKQEVKAEEKNEKIEEFIRFEITPQEINYGDFVTLKWNVQGALNRGKKCNAIGPDHWNGPLTIGSGSKKVSPDQTREYRVVCDDSSPLSQIARVKKESEKGSRLDLYIQNAPDSGVVKGEGAILKWNYEFGGPSAAQACKLFDSFDKTLSEKGLLTGRNPSVPNRGSKDITPQEEGQIYRFECLGKSIELPIHFSSPRIDAFRAYTVLSNGSQNDLSSGEEIKIGTKVWFEWDARGAEKCRGNIMSYREKEKTYRYEKSDDALIAKSNEYSDDERAWHNKNLPIPTGKASVTPLASRIYGFKCDLDIRGQELYDFRTFEVKTSLDIPTLSFSLRPISSLQEYGPANRVIEYKAGALPYEIKWSGENISMCEAVSSDGSWKGRRGIRGQEIVFPAEAASFSMECSSKAGKKVRQGPLKPQLKQSLSFVFSDAPSNKTIETKAGYHVNVKWNSQGAHQCSASAQPQSAWDGIKGYEGEETVRVDRNTTYTLACGSQKESLSLTVEKKLLPKPVQKQPQLTVNSAPLPGSVTGATPGIQQSVGRYAFSAKDGDITLESLDFEIKGSNDPFKYVKDYSLYDLTTNAKLAESKLLDMPIKNMSKNLNISVLSLCAHDSKPEQWSVLNLGSEEAISRARKKVKEKDNLILYKDENNYIVMPPYEIRSGVKCPGGSTKEDTILEIGTPTTYAPEPVVQPPFTFLKNSNVIFDSASEMPFSGLILEDGETHILELRADTTQVAKNAHGAVVALTTLLNKEHGVQWSFRPAGDEKKRVVQGPAENVLGSSIAYTSVPQPIKREKGELSAARETESLMTASITPGKILSLPTFFLRAQKEAITVSSFELTSDIPELLTAFTNIQLRSGTSSSVLLPARMQMSGKNSLAVYGFGDVAIPAGQAASLQLSLVTPPVLPPHIEGSLRKAGSDTIRLTSAAAIGNSSAEKIGLSAPLPLLTIVPPQQIVEKPHDKEERLSISSFSFSNKIVTPGSIQTFSEMNIHNFSGKPIEVGGAVVKFSQPFIERVELHYSTRGGSYDEKAERVSGSGTGDYFYFKFPKPLLIEPDPKSAYKRGEAGLMKWWINGIPKSAPSNVIIETLLYDVLAQNGDPIRLESHTEPIISFSVSNLNIGIGDAPVSNTILTVAKDQPLLLQWTSEGLDEKAGCIASIGLGGNERDRKEWSGKKRLNGEAWVYPSATTLYKIDCLQGERAVTRNVFVQINEISKSVPFIDFSYRLGKNSKKQEGVYLTWLVKNASSCEASNGPQEKQTSWKGIRLLSDREKISEFVTRPAGETSNTFFFTCTPRDKGLQGYFASSLHVRWGQEEEQISLSLAENFTDDFPVGVLPGRQRLGAFALELPAGTTSFEKIVLARDERFGERSLESLFKSIELEYLDQVSGDRYIASMRTDGDKPLIFTAIPHFLKGGARRPISVTVYGELVSADILRTLKVSEQGERMRFMVTDIEAKKKDTALSLFEPFLLQTFLVKVVPPPPPPPPIAQKGVLFATLNGNREIELKEGAVRLVLANLTLEALGEDIEILNVAISHTFGKELASILLRPQLVAKKGTVAFGSAVMQDGAISSTPLPFTKFILPKTGVPVELELIADIPKGIAESLKERIREKPIVLSIRPDSIKARGLASNMMIDTTPFGAQGILTAPPKTVENTACDATVEEFKKTGKIRCGRIAWELTPKSAQLFTGDPRPYLMKYDDLYGFYKDFMAGYEPRQGKVTLQEIPTNPYPADADWQGSVIHMDTPFTKDHIIYLGNSASKTFSPSFMHEMGHIFGLGPSTRPAYIWKDMTEGHANMVGILPYMMAFDGKFQLTSDFWCKNKLKKAWPCADYFTNFEDYPEWLGANKDLDEYQREKETFKTLFVTPPADQNIYERGGKFMTMITTLYSEFKKQGKGAQFWEGYKKAQQFYIKNPSVFPPAWLQNERDFATATDIALQVDTYLLLLSAYSKSDILQTFETRWRFPVLPKVKEAWKKIESQNYNENTIVATVKELITVVSPFPGKSSLDRETLQLRGLQGEYYNNRDLNGRPASTRVDSQIDFVWGLSSPASGIAYDGFSIRWNGFIVPSETAEYSFSTIGDDGVRLWIDNKKLIDDWNVHAPKINEGKKIRLEKGKEYPITLEYFDEYYGAGIRLLWAKNGGYEDVVPSSVLTYKPLR